MRQSSVIIHKGRKEEKYEIFVEDYVISFLKDETGTLELSELYFYGIKEDAGRRYIIYGAGKNKKLAEFNKYSLFEEIGCRLTQAGPVFLVKEGSSIYEIKGYKIFYQDNREMQDYLIERKTETNRTSRTSAAVRNADIPETNTQKVSHNKSSYSAISIQLGIVLVALVAIVINSTNSYDKMNQLNRSAVEVLFAIENQEADDGTVINNLGQEGDILNSIVLENEEQEWEVISEKPAEEEENEDVTEEAVTQDTAKPDDTAPEETVSNEERQDDNSAENSEEPEEIEALSRNVTRYYEVEKGDTLYTISKKIYGDVTYVQKICELNQITNPDNIRYGQKIVLP